MAPYIPSDSDATAAQSANGCDESSKILRVRGTDIVDGSGKRVILKGAALGGHMNMENFITGYSGHENEHRAAMLSVLGREKYDFFFDKFLDYFFTASDAKFFASCGLNCIRIPFNYRHFENDLNPGVYIEKGFKLLDHIVQLCAAENLYVVLDMHAVPGGQNQDWHSDAGLHKALFWNFKEFQDRAINLWLELARRYKGNPIVAGYNVLNEPADPDHVNLIAFYERAEREIRQVDPDHILFLDGNTYAMDFSRFPEKPLPNCVYAMHDYSNMGFPSQPQYEGTAEQKAKLRKSFERKAAFMRSRGVPIWNGEFGPVYAAADHDEDFETTNKKRFALLKEQLSIYRELNVSWSIWLYKDIGHMGMVYVSPESAWIKLLKPFLDKKEALCVDFWGSDFDRVKDIYDPFIAKLKEMVPEHLQKSRYPKTWTIDRQIVRVVREMLLSEYMTLEMAEYFKDKTFEELDELASSFKLENCCFREELNETLRNDAELSKDI